MMPKAPSLKSLARLISATSVLVIRQPGAEKREMDGEPPVHAEDENTVEIELSAEESDAIRAVEEMLVGPLLPSATAESLELRLESTGAPLRVESDARQGGRRVVATRSIAPGEILLSEDAVGWFIAPPPGSGAVSAMAGADGRMIAALPAWLSLRLLRDTLAFAPSLDAEVGYATLSQLTAGDHPCAGLVAPPLEVPPATPPGLLATPGNAVPPRAQLIGALAQCNAFQVPLPCDDSPWKRALLWPALGRIVEAADRDALFDDDAPLSAVSAFFPLAALLNHSCTPDAVVDCGWAEGAPAPRATVRAVRAVPEGTEVTHAYVDPATLGAAERRATLLVTYGFVCACGRCAAEVPHAGTSGADPLLDAGHFPEGVGLRGRAAFFARGGAYPPVEPPVGDARAS